MRTGIRYAATFGRTALMTMAVAALAMTPDLAGAAKKKKHVMTSDECQLIGGVVVITSTAGDMMCCSDSSHRHCAPIKDPLLAEGLRQEPRRPRGTDIRPVTPSFPMAPPARGGAAPVR